MARNESKWELYLAHAAEWFEMTGEIPRGEEHPGGWVQQQRSALRGGFSWLTPERIEKLDASLPGWRDKPSPRSREWIVSAAALCDFASEKQTLPPQTSDDLEERRLALWLSGQRAHLHRGELRRDRTEWLDEHVPEWRGRGRRSDAWRRNALELSDWVRREGRFPSPRSDDADERRLGQWMKNRLDDLRADKLTTGRIALLDDAAPG
ncbi:hypothetical protein ASD19_13825 [Microbacterium sp. Root53]|uniref:helicase associated domain-containing protein n=1 Tax=Microbacterium sp. Root53 TaxID=1736553 RepID=UPI0006F249F6|nr:helicase associated domain-containing protein [Microbacterium sp. Root53]KQZ02700.1 hypothetical protein ASD19_13825 [Microbacterium sp. Root53]